jgi:broad specificity phosphatase PhoE
MHANPSRSARIGALAILAVGILSNCADAQRVIYIVRHAEKELTGDQPLTNAGKKRAQALADLLKNANIKAIYTSDALRTQQTAQPLATALSIAPETIDEGDAGKTYEEALHQHWNDAILIVGHSDTIQDLLRKWSANASIQIAPTDFSTLLVITPEAPGKAGWARLRYEAP